VTNQLEFEACVVFCNKFVDINTSYLWHVFVLCLFVTSDFTAEMSQLCNHYQ